MPANFQAIAEANSTEIGPRLKPRCGYSRSMRRWLLFVPMVAVATSCSASEVEDGGDESPDSSTVVADTAGPTTSEIVEVETSRADPPVEPSEPASATLPGERTSVAAVLAALPREIRRLAVRDGRNSIVNYVDLNGAAEDLGLTPIRQSGNVDAAADVLQVITAVEVSAQQGTGYTAFLPDEFPGRDSWRDSAAFEAELGFSPFDFSAVGQFAATQLMAAVAFGDLTVAPDLVADDAGVTTVGTGEEGVIDPASGSVARPLGRPLYLNSQERYVVVSRLRPLIEASVIAPENSLLSEPRYAEMAEILDRSGVTTASIFEGDLAVPYFEVDDPEYLALAYPISEPFGMVGVGGRVVEGRTIATVVYGFTDASAADRALPMVLEVWQQSQSVVTRDLRFGAIFESFTIERSGSMVVLVGQIADGERLLRVEDFLDQRDAAFVHR